MKRGQTSIEFIFLILIIVIYLVTIVRPAFDSAQSSFEDIDKVTKASNETQKIVNSINRISSLSDGSKETLFITLPEGVEINCYNEGKLDFMVEINTNGINPNIESCAKDVCQKEYQTSPLNCEITQILGAEKIIVEKDGTTITIKVG